MRYLVNTSNGKLRKVFRAGLVYDERIIRAEIAKMGLKLVRPNGDTRTRGSRRLYAKDGADTLAAFQADIKEDTGPILPVPVGYV